MVVLKFMLQQPLTLHVYMCRNHFCPLCYVAGLSFYTSNKGLSDAFSQYGQVVEGDFGSALHHAIMEHSFR